MSEFTIRETEIQQKEAELERAIQDYYRFDMSGLKSQIENAFDAETEKVNEERKLKLKEIEEKFRSLNRLGTDHVNRGTRHKGQVRGVGRDAALNDIASDEKLLADFEAYSEKYEDQVRQANEGKQTLREEILQLERELRAMRDTLANKEMENKNLTFLLDREHELQQAKSQKEDEALRLLNDDLAMQLSAIEEKAGVTGGNLVRPKNMEEALRAQQKRTIEGYEQFVAESAQELQETERELNMMQTQLEQEQRVTQTLEYEKQLNQEELDRLGADYQRLDKELKDLTFAFESKQSELEQLRVQAGDDARKLSIELCQAQKETNVLVLEVKKYEGLHRFMDLERDLIEKAQKDAMGLNPAISAQDVEMAEERQEQLQMHIEDITREWQEKLEEVRTQSERVLNVTELEEFQTRIVMLTSELADKTKEIERIQVEKKRIEETIDQTMDLEIDLKSHTAEIDLLNDRYRKALKNKVGVYDELMKAVRMLADRNAKFMGNEIEVNKLVNLTSITKKELEQKEKIHQELKESIENHDDAARLAAQSDRQIASKQSKIETLSNELYQKDQMIEQLQALLKAKEAQEQKIHMEMEQLESNEAVEDEDRVIKTNFAPQQIRGNQRGANRGALAGNGPSQPNLPPRDDYVFQRDSYAPQGVDPRNVWLDSLVIQELQQVSAPFPIVKVVSDPESGGAYYVFGTRLVLIRDMGDDDDNLLTVREYKSHGDELFGSYLTTQVEPVWTHIQSLLRTTKQHLLSESDPVQALSIEFVNLYKRELDLE